VLPLAAADAVGVVLFGTLYAVAFADLLSQGAFLSSLLLLFALVTTLWMQAEARNQPLPALRRAGRAVMGLVVVVIATPALVLMPLFWLDTQLPPEAGLRSKLAPVMTILLIALALVLMVNLAGSIVVVARAVYARRRRVAH
jgi:hypothetical protein